MGLSTGEAAALLSRIMSHHGNATWDDLQFDSFRSELLPDLTAVEAVEAVRRFYASNDSGRWMGAGDVNAIVKRMRGERRPSEATICREAERLGLSEDQTWAYRRARIRGGTQAVALEEAKTTRPLLPSGPERRPARGIVDVRAMNLHDVLGGQ